MIAQFGLIGIVAVSAGRQRDAAFHEMTSEHWNSLASVLRIAESLTVTWHPANGIPRQRAVQLPVVSHASRLGRWTLRRCLA
ncbi:MAG: hypothetical protein ACREEA_03355 [Stellaceae bacterium]